MNTRLTVALVIVGILAVAVIGLVAAQVATSAPSGTTTNGTPSGGFFGWMGRCLGFRSSQYYGTGTRLSRCACEAMMKQVISATPRQNQLN